MVASSISGPRSLPYGIINRSNKTFHPFRRLPIEIQGMIWSVLIPKEPIFFEVSEYDEDTLQYEITGEAADVMAICGPHNSVPGVFPIYLPRGRNKEMPDPIYFRPLKDILYIPFPEQLDTITMSLMKENQLIRKLGIVSTAFDCLSMGSHMVFETSAIPFLTDLKNLKEMYIIDGHAKGLEDWEERPYPYGRDFTFDLSDVRVGSIGRNFYNGTWEIWSSSHVDEIRKAFEEQKWRIASTLEDDNWVLPKIVGKTIWRK